MSEIPLSAPSFNGNEWKYLKDCIDTGWVSSAGKYVSTFEEKVANYVGTKYAISCINGTSALYLSLRLMGVEAEDEVIVPTLTFIGTINAISYTGAFPVFMDADDFFNMDIEKTIKFIKEETRFNNHVTYNKTSGRRISAIIPVHVWGNAVWLDELTILCKERNIKIIEDAAESLGTHYLKGDNKNKHTGSVGDIGCLSFNGNKIITSGGGGMILTSDPEVAKKAKYFSTQAKDDALLYIHNEVGYNFRLTNIQAALGLAQLEQLDSILLKKKEINQNYISKLLDIEGLSICNTPGYATNNHWLNILKINSLIYIRDKEELIQIFLNNGIEVRPIWHLNHLQVPYSGFQTYKIENALNLIRHSLCMPSSFDLNEADLNKVVKSLL
jgi:perosamine synthetase